MPTDKRLLPLGSSLAVLKLITILQTFDFDNANIFLKIYNTFGEGYDLSAYRCWRGLRKLKKTMPALMDSLGKELVDTEKEIQKRLRAMMNDNIKQLLKNHTVEWLRINRILVGMDILIFIFGCNPIHRGNPHSCQGRFFFRRLKDCECMKLCREYTTYITQYRYLDKKKYPRPNHYPSIYNWYD